MDGNLYVYHISRETWTDLSFLRASEAGGGVLCASGHFSVEDNSSMQDNCVDGKVIGHA